MNTERQERFFLAARARNYDDYRVIRDKQESLSIHAMIK